jgi:hypothetical protein
MRYTLTGLTFAGHAVRGYSAAGSLSTRIYVKSPPPLAPASAVRLSCFRRGLLVLLVGITLLVGGCSQVHTRQWGYPSRLGRRLDAIKGSARISKARSPQVNLRFEPAPAASAGARTTRLPDG